MTTKEKLQDAQLRLLALPELTEKDSELDFSIKDICLSEILHELVNLSMERIKELENENEVLKRSL